MTRAAPLFADHLLPRQRRGIEGFPVGAAVAFGPALKGLERTGVVINTLPRHNMIVVRTTDDRIADVTPERCRVIHR